MLKPHVDLANDSPHYRGEIGPGFTAADWAAWFASYRPFILHYAAMAARTGCELYCVGCELGTTAVHAVQWREIVAAVREVYAGPLTYADNQVEWDPEAVTWWDAVDFIGQDVYPTLTQVVEPTVEDLSSRLDVVPGQAPAAFRKVGKAPSHDGDRLPERSRRRPEPLGLAESRER